MRYRALLLALVLLVGCSPSAVAQLPLHTPAQATAAPTATQPAPVAQASTAEVRAKPTTRPPEPIRSFPQTGHTLHGAFRSFWEARGGLRIFGLPLTEALWVDSHQVQYFERARFELGDDQQVHLGLLGSEAAPPAPATTPDNSCRFFAETGHNLCAPFLDYWQQHGGLPIFGLPLAEAEEHEDVRTQRFERARFEQPQPQTIALGRIGDEALAALPGGMLLRPSSAQVATYHAAVTPIAETVAPLSTVNVAVQVPGYTGPASVTVADRRGTQIEQTVPVTTGLATVAVPVQGALGQHAVAVTINGKIAGLATTVFRSDAQTVVTTGQPRFDRLLPLVKGFMAQDISEYTFGPNKVHGYRSPDSNLLWLRDHVHQGKGYAYWEPDMRSLLDQFRRFQHADGAFDDYMANFPWGEVRGRTAVEADNEYLFIEGVYRAWQATGDDQWLSEQIDAMERGLRYIRTSPDRWDDTHQLVKRPFTVDTWDFEYGPPTTSPDGKPAPRHWIDDQTKWSIFHGDNTGYANSMNLLARMYEHLGNQDRATYWRTEARGLMDRLVALAWNGSYFRHMVHLVPVDVPGVDEASQLSLSNAYALNRSGLTEQEAQAIIQEYQRRYQNRGSTFAEWYSIDPPFPQGSLSTGDGWGRNTGEYVNGGIMPLVGGELARGAFNHSYERYGFDILQRYYSLIDGTGGSYLWYHPIGQPGLSGPDTLSTDGWGSSAMLAALLEGAAGIRDEDKLFQTATISPRWTATDDVQAASVTVRYGASDGYVTYHWQRSANSLELQWTGSGDEVRLHLLLPTNAPEHVNTTLNGTNAAATITGSGESRSVVLVAPGSGSVKVSW